MAGRQYNAFMVDIETLLWNEPGQRDMQMSVSMATSDRLIIRFAESDSRPVETLVSTLLWPYDARFSHVFK